MNFALARKNMVDCQVRTNKVTDPAIIEAFSHVPRESFVPASQKNIAYVDDDLAIGHGRYLTEPMVLARLFQAAAITPQEMVLIIGCATGYSAAIAAQLASTVVAIDDHQDWIDRAEKALLDIQITNVALFQGSLTNGYPSQAPYPVILIDGAIEELPPAIVDQLSEGGRLVTVARQHSIGRAMIYTKFGGQVTPKVLFDANVPVIPAFRAMEKFVL